MSTEPLLKTVQKFDRISIEVSTANFKESLIILFRITMSIEVCNPYKTFAESYRMHI